MWQHLETLGPVYVLAGGRGERFGGGKPMAPLGDQPLVARAVAPLLPLADGVVGVVDRADALAPLPWPVLCDARPHQGPGHALAAALRHRGRGWLWLAACDVIGLQTPWLAALQLCAMRGDGQPAGSADQPQRRVLAVAWLREQGMEARWQPLPSLWHTDALPAVEAALAAGRDALWQLLDAVQATALAPPRGLAEVARVDTREALARVAAALPALTWREVLHLRSGWAFAGTDAVAVEAPLRVLVTQGRRRRDLGITMRSPGDDADLALGLAWSEGLLKAADDVQRITHTDDVVRIRLTDTAPRLASGRPRVRTGTSACGACGLADWPAREAPGVASQLQVPLETLLALPEALRRAQQTYAATGAQHAAALFDATGALLAIREDIGRHNALDKLLGALLVRGALPASAAVLVLSGRAAQELLHKAAQAGIAVVVAVGAPSSAAVAVAEAAGITLVGFAARGGANVYSHAWRLGAQSR